MTVFFSVCCFFSTVMLTLFGIICGTMIGSFRGVNDQLLDTLQSCFQILRRRQLTIRHQFEMHQGIVQNR